MPTRLPPPNWVRAFEAAARLGGPKAAAQELGVTPSAVSQQIRLLEERLATQLFTRSQRGVTLTAVGRAYADALIGAFAQIDERTRELFTPAPRRTLKLRIDSSLALIWLPRRLPRFRVSRPGLDVHVRAVTWDDRGELDGDDCVIWFGTTLRLPAGAEVLTRERLVPVAAPALAANTTSPAEVGRLPLLHVLADPVGWRDWFEAAGLDPAPSSIGPRFDASAGVLEMAIHGGGAALAKETLVADKFAAESLARLPGPVLAPDAGFCMTGATSARASEDARAFAHWIRQELAAIGRAE